MKIYCLICARKNSKGLPNKNIKLLNGMPLITHTLRFAKKIKHFEKIYVSSDSEKIRKISKFEKVKFDQRPKYLSGDKTSELKVWKYSLKKFIKENKIKINDIIVILPCTAPLRRRIDILRMIKKFKNSKLNGLVAITKSKKNPYFNMIKLSSTNKILKLMPDNNKVNRRQDAPDVYDITTNCYIFRISYILKADHIFQNSVEGYEVPYYSTIDIDDKFDFQLAKKLMRK